MIVAGFELRNLVGRQVVLSVIDTGARFSFVIDTATPSVIVLHPTEPDARAFAASVHSGTPLRLSSPVADGLVIANIVAEHWSISARVLTVSSSGAVEVMQRRSVFRVPVTVGVGLAVSRGDDVRFAEGWTVDLSERGMAVVARGLTVEAGESLATILRLGDHEMLVVSRVVVPGDGARQPIRLQITQILAAEHASLAAEVRQAEVGLVRIRAGRRG